MITASRSRSASSSRTAAGARARSTCRAIRGRRSRSYRNFEPLCARLETRAAWRRVVIRPGERERLTLHPFYGRHGFTFEEPGTYVVHARLTLPGVGETRLGATSLYVKSGGAS